VNIEVTREPILESVHQVWWAVAEPDGTVVESEGRLDFPVVLRSAAKPFQAMAVLAGGVAEAFGLSAAEVALLGGSHHGEPVHVDAVRSILSKAGVSESCLQCGAHVPYNKAAREALEASGTPALPIHNNCSGKHAGLLALCRLLGAPLETYMERRHPVQEAVFRSIAAFCGAEPEAIPWGVDGCGLPVAAVTLPRAAAAFARWATGEEVGPSYAAVAARLREAQRLNPVMVNGTEGFNTHLLQAAPHLVAKSGAEGVFCVGNIRTRQGLAVKIPDGNNRGIAVATTALLKRLGWLDAAGWQALSAHHSVDVLNVAGRRVGAIRPAGV
jgi:L-asparaginase II